jgi:predicted ATPase
MSFVLDVEWFRGIDRARLSLEEGIYALVGPNGVGKTTVSTIPLLLRHAFQRGWSSAVRENGGSWSLRNLAAPTDARSSIRLATQDATWKLSTGGGDRFPDEEFHLLNGAYPGLPRAIRTQVDGQIWSVHPSYNEEQDQTKFEPLRLAEPGDDRMALRAVVDAGLAPGSEAFTIWISSVRSYLDYAVTQLRDFGSKADTDLYLSSNGHNVGAVLRNWRDRRDTASNYSFVIDGMKDIFGPQFDGIEFEGASNTVSIRIFRSGFDRSIPLSNQSTGLIRGLLHMTAIAGAKPGSFISIDDFEDGLHPVAIRRLLAQARQRAAEKRLTVLVATHSPVLLNAFGDDPENVLLFEPRLEERTKLSADDIGAIIPLTHVKHPDTLSQFNIGDLYGFGEVAAPQEPV